MFRLTRSGLNLNKIVPSIRKVVNTSNVPVDEQTGLGKLPTGPTRPYVSIKIFPPFAEFIEFGGASRHMITNDGSCRVVFKIKCSNNEVFKVSPVFAFLEAGASIELQILRKEGPPKHDKLIILLKEAKVDDKDLRVSIDSPYPIYKHVIPLLTRIVEDFDSDSQRPSSATSATSSEKNKTT